jgi:SAM-dependent methyltransferase
MSNGSHVAHRVFSTVLRGGAAFMHGIGTDPLPLGIHAWRARADDTDRALLQHCEGPTLDVGCGPGRMTAELLRMGLQAIGIDVSAEAVGMSRKRGVVALLADVFSPLPAEGLWQTVLLADGNVGIGGDPDRLLRRAWQLVGAGGRVVADLAPSGVEPGRHRVTVETDGVHSEPFWWAVVAPEAVLPLARRVGFTDCELHCAGERTFAVLHKSL